MPCPLRQHDPGASSGHYNVPHCEPKHRELPVQTLHQRKYGTDILYRGKEMVRGYRKDWHRPSYANCPRRMAPSNRRAPNHYNHMGRGLHVTSALQQQKPLAPRTISTYLSGVRKYLENVGVDTRFMNKSQYIIRTQHKAGPSPILPGVYEPNHRRPGKNAGHRRSITPYTPPIQLLPNKQSTPSC